MLANEGQAGTGAQGFAEADKRSPANLLGATRKDRDGPGVPESLGSFVVRCSWDTKGRGISELSQLSGSTKLKKKFSIVSPSPFV